MGKIKKYIFGFFALLGGILVAFLAGKSAGKKDEKFKGLKKESKKVSDMIKSKEKAKKALENTLKSKKKAMAEMKKTKKKGYKKKNVEAKEASKHLKSYLNKKKSRRK